MTRASYTFGSGGEGGLPAVGAVGSWWLQRVINRPPAASFVQESKGGVVPQRLRDERRLLHRTVGPLLGPFREHAVLREARGPETGTELPMRIGVNGRAVT